MNNVFDVLRRRLTTTKQTNITNTLNGNGKDHINNAAVKFTVVVDAAAAAQDGYEKEGSTTCARPEESIDMG